MELPAEFKERMKDMLKDEYPEFEEAFLSDEEYVGVRVLKPYPQILKILEGCEKVKWCENGFYADKTVISGKHPYHAAGLIYFQEPSAMLPIAALPVGEDDYVLDLCAAPGGKSTQITEKLGSGGLLVANEIIPKRAGILAENIERCGGENVVVTNENPEKLAEKFPEFFDKIVVDAPCSGEGMFRKEPQALSQWSVPHTLSCAVRQRHILDCAVKMLKPGGYLIYSTCTFSPDENEKNVDYLLNEYPELSLAPIKAEGVSDGINGYGTFDMKYTKRIFPHTAKGEGHFAALLKKSGTAYNKCREKQKNVPPKLFADFEKETLNTALEGYFHTFGDRLFLLPDKISFDKIKVICPGLYLGDMKKGRFEPSYALAHACKKDDFKDTVVLSDSELLKYLHGDVIPCEKKGWTGVLYENFVIGWGKAGGGSLKNHFPKKLRI